MTREEFRKQMIETVQNPQNLARLAKAEEELEEVIKMMGPYDPILKEHIQGLLTASRNAAKYVQMVYVPRAE